MRNTNFLLQINLSEVFLAFVLGGGLVYIVNNQSYYFNSQNQTVNQKQIVNCPHNEISDNKMK
jgi:hypothetical protein